MLQKSNSLSDKAELNDYRKHIQIAHHLFISTFDFLTNPGLASFMTEDM